MDQEAIHLEGFSSTTPDDELLRVGIRALQMVESEKIAVSVAAHPPEPTSADARLTWERVWIRILVPFTFRLDSEHKAETGFDWLGRSRQALKDAADARRQPWKRGVYQREPTAGELPVHPDYTSDYYGHVIRFLFGDSEPTQTGCECWRIDPNDIARWLRNTSLVVVRGTGEHSVSEVEPGWLNRRERWPVNAIDDCGAELFLSQMGAGVLSISLELLPPVCRAPHDTVVAEATPRVSVLGGLLHALATGQKEVWFCRHMLDGYPSDENGVLRRPPFEECLHDNTQAFSWSEIVAWLLEPLRANGLQYQAENRDMASIAIQVPRTSSLEEAVARGQALSELAQLSQLHTTTHPGEMTGESHSVPLVINRSHVASMSLSGVAHAVSREIPSDGAVNSYDIAHLRRAHFEYFVAWLVAVIQRLALRQSIERGVRLVQLRRNVASELDGLQRERAQLLNRRNRIREKSPGPKGWLQSLFPGNPDPSMSQRLQQIRDERKTVQGKLRRLQRHWSTLRAQLLDFNLQGEFVQVSPRSTVQHFYDKAQEATQVPAAQSKIRGAMTDWDTAQRAEDSANMARKANASIKAIKRMHGNLEWVEILILGACLVEVMHYLSEHYINVIVSLVLLALVGTYAAVRLFRPQKHAPLNQAALIRAILLLLAVAVISAVLLARESRTKTEGTNPPAAIRQPN